MDLATVRRAHPDCALHGVDFSDVQGAILARDGVRLHVADIERDRLPFDDGSVDLVIANQVLEHTKEVYWILHEVFRILRPGGSLFLGVPNLLSLHNRVLMLVGGHPTQHKLYSAHVRVFSIADVRRFFRFVTPDLVRVHPPMGAQFYPFPRWLARPLARWFPGLAFTIFFRLEKLGSYRGEILRWPAHASLETNFRVGLDGPVAGRGARAP